MNEPVMALVLGLVTSGIALLIAFGVSITEAQTAAIGGFVAAALALGFYVRSKVTPTRRLRDRPAVLESRGARDSLRRR